MNEDSDSIEGLHAERRGTEWEARGAEKDEGQGIWRYEPGVLI